MIRSRMEHILEGRNPEGMIPPGFEATDAS
jgi:hypothetical protein